MSGYGYTPRLTKEQIDVAGSGKKLKSITIKIDLTQMDTVIYEGTVDSGRFVFQYVNVSEDSPIWTDYCKYTVVEIEEDKES